jgi:hypothetical protein
MTQNCLVFQKNISALVREARQHIGPGEIVMCLEFAKFDVMCNARQAAEETQSKIVPATAIPDLGKR